MTGNHYQTLEIGANSTAEEIKQAYRRLAKRFHPDRQTDSASHERIVAINAAYEILGDPQRRQQYDEQLTAHSPATRQRRAAEAQKSYNRAREARQDDEILAEQWRDKTYSPIDRLIGQIIRPLNKQIDALSADPFDDELMGDFQRYLETCRQNLDRARTIFSARKNPSKMAGVAAALYYCLNHLGDGLDELETFTYNYDDRSLHTGKEMFRLANRLKTEAREMVGKSGGR
ncbi:DnaJ domain-containing protein [Pannus brasiliensis CCIBt3594]|uniref:DnaJ domain-containing protein n=1 Tax=Pannus brasiliensis CCIBt3594 TaxID=1427578 RepID=A0AAW9QYY0_9CHRO